MLGMSLLMKKKMRVPPLGMYFVLNESCYKGIILLMN